MNMPSMLDITQQGEVVVVKLNRPAKRNAINDTLMDELEMFFGMSEPKGKVVVLHAEGEHFCAGLDLIELLEKRSANPDPIMAMRRSRQWHRVFDMIQYGERPVISVLKGSVVGGGLELAAATHVRVSEGSAFYQLPEGQRGIFVGGGGSVRVPRIIGSGRVVEMMLTGRSLSAAEGLQLGLSHYLVEQGEGLETAMKLAQVVAGNVTTSNYAIINGISRISEMSTSDGLFAETMVSGLTRNSSKESKERITDFFESRRMKSKT